MSSPIPAAEPARKSPALAGQGTCRFEALGIRSVDIDDLDPAVLRFLDAIGGRNQQVVLALRDDLDLG